VPLADTELNPPGEIEIVVAPLVVQLSALFPPELMLVGFAVKAAIEGAEAVPWAASDELVVPAQLIKSIEDSRIRTSTLRPSPEGLRV